MVDELLKKFDIRGLLFRKLSTKELMREKINESIECWSNNMKRWEGFFKGSYEIHRKYDVGMVPGSKSRGLCLRNHSEIPFCDFQDTLFMKNVNTISLFL
ncbi:MAG: hypothetical protein ACUVQ0_06260 [Thermoproteota archaeon]